MFEFKENSGRFTASRIKYLLAGGQVRKSLLFELAKERCGLERNIKTAAMRHGNEAEELAASYVKSYLPNIKFQSDQHININENAGATPDCIEIIGEAGLTIDIKCPVFRTFKKYKLNNYLALTHYSDQVQMQQLALKENGCKLTHGKLFIFLKKQYGDDYVFKKTDSNHFFIDVKDSEIRQRTILREIENAVPERDGLVDLILESSEIEIDEAINNNELIEFTNQAKPKKLFFCEGLFFMREIL